ncbi:MAG: ISH3 family transposase [Anaerolineae bacterium]
MATQQLALTSETVRHLGLSVLEEHLPLHGNSDPQAETVTSQDCLSVLLYAAAHQTSIEQAASQLETGPHPNTVRNRIDLLNIAELEVQLNAGMRSRLPSNLLDRPRRIAIDLTYIPYYGQVTEENQMFIRRGKAKAGTTRFFVYATLYVIQPDKRLTVALRFVRKEERLLEIIADLLARFRRMGGQVKRLYVDRGFYQVKVVRYLKQQDLSFVMLAPANEGIKKRFVGSRSYWTPYVMNSPTDGKEEVELAVVRQYSRGKHGRHGIEWAAYVVHNYDRPLQTVAEEYRKRFGIESSYASMNEARGRTASRKPGVRLVLVGIALVLMNLWVYLKWQYVSWRRRGGRRVFAKRFPFQKLLTFLSQELEEIYGVVREVWIPAPDPGRSSKERRAM